MIYIPAPRKTIRLVHDGNSIVYGYGLASPTTQRYSAVLQGMLDSARASSTNSGVSGIPTWSSGDSMIARYSNAGHPGASDVYQSPPIKSVLVAWELTNEIRNVGSSTADTLAHWAQYVALGRATGYEVWSFTCLPCVAFTAGTELVRLRANAEIRLNSGGVYGDRILDAASWPQFADYTNGTWYLDQVHPTVAGHQLIAARLFECLLTERAT